MANSASSNYLVVKMSDPITKKGMGFKCIPSSWIQNTLIDNYLITRYPLEENTETELKVKNRQAASKNWPFYCATIVFKTDVYEEAIKYMENSDKKESRADADKQEDNMSEQRNVTENETPTANKRKLSEENDNKSPTDNSLPKKRRITATSSKKPVKKKLIANTNKQKSSPKAGLSLRKGARTKTLKTLIRSGRFNTLEELYNSRESPTKSKPQKEDNNEDITPIDISDSSDIEFLPSSPAKNKLESEIDPKAEENTSINAGVSILENLLTMPPIPKKFLTEKPSKLNLKQLANIYNTILEVKSKLNAVYQEANLALKQSFEAINLPVPELKELSPSITEKTQLTSSTKPLSPFPNLGSPKGQEPVPLKLNTPSQPELTRIEGPTQTEGPTSQLPKTSQPSPTNKTVDSKWTLRHQGPGIGLVELMPFSGVYVSQAELSNCQALVTDMKKFARALLPIIFTKEALRTCTYTGNKPRNKLPESFEVRPGLDENARQTLLAYVRKHGSECGWTMLSPEVIITSLKNKLQVQKYKNKDK